MFTGDSSKLYRYRSGGNLGRVLQEIRGSHWFSTAEHLNDPFDGIAGLPAEDIDEIRSFVGRPDGSDAPTVFNVRVVAREEWMIACFSEAWDSVPMWAHYASSGSGYCIEYDRDRLRELLHAHQQNPIVYGSAEPVLAPVKYVDTLPSDVDPIKERVFAKASAWLYEREWRAAIRGVAVATQRGGMAVNLDGAITGVAIGWSTAAENFAPMQDAIERLRATNHKVGLVAVSIDPSSRELRIDRRWPHLD